MQKAAPRILSFGRAPGAGALAPGLTRSGVVVGTPRYMAPEQALGNRPTRDRIQDDPEAIFLQGWLLCDAGPHEAGLAYLQRAIAKGYSPAPTFERGRQFDRLGSLPAFQAVVAEAEAGRERARAAFRDADGERSWGSGVRSQES